MEYLQPAAHEPHGVLDRRTANREPSLTWRPLIAWLAAFLALVIPASTGQAEGGGSPESGKPPTGSVRHPADGPESVSGHIIVEGGDRKRPLVVSLRDHAPDGELDEFGLPALRVQAHPESGAFGFEGLPRGWSGRLYLPPGFMPSDTSATSERPSRYLELSAPAQDIELHVQLVPALVGRVVHSSGGGPVSDAQIGWASSRKGGPMQLDVRWRITADSEGRFRIELEEDPDSIVVGVSDREGRGKSYRRFAREDLTPTGPHVVDLGDLRLLPYQEIVVLVKNELGKPVEKAVALALEPAGEDQGETDAAGRAVLPGRGGVTHIAVGKPGFWPVKVSVPESPTEPIAVTLKPENRLEVTLLNQHGEPEPSLDVALSSDGPLFGIQTEEGGWIEVPDRVGGTWVEWRDDLPSSYRSSRIGLDVPTGVDGWVAVRRIWPGKTLTLKVKGNAIGNVLHQQALAPMGEGEHRDLIVRVDVPSPVVGVVLSPDGDAVPYARITVQAGENLGAVYTDDAGRFELKGFSEDRAHFQIEQDDYSVMLAPDVDLRGAEGELRFVLDSLNFVRVRVVDESGRTIPDVAVGAQDLDSGAILAFGYKQDGTVTRVNVPKGEVMLWARLPGLSDVVKLQHDTTIPEATLTLPLQAALLASWEMPRGRGVTRGYLVLTPADGSESLKYEIVEEGRRSGSVQVFAPPGEYEAYIEKLRWKKPNEPITERSQVVLDPEQTTKIVLTPRAHR